MEACSCAHCVSACRRDPGRLVPSDLAPLARLLELTPAELLARYLVLRPLPGAEGGYALAPVKWRGHRLLVDPGTVVPDYYEEEPGRCVFLEEEGCRVHAAKPFECRAYSGCRHTFLGRPYRRKEVEEYFRKRWRSAQETIRKLRG
jgi:Fe-S-cluster containining protein